MDRIETRLISYSGRIREADPKRVSVLAESIREIGLLNPITVHKTTIIRAGQDVDGYGLIAGMHRLRACQELGWSEIPAVIVELDEDDRIIAECDENLCVAELTPSDRATFTAKRKEAYLRKYPETAKPGPRSDSCGQVGHNSFADDQAEKTGQAARSIRRDAERGEKVSPAALDIIRGTKLDTGVYLDKLKALSPEAQVAKARADLAPPKHPARQDASAAKRSKIDADVKDRAAREVAEMLAEHVPGEWWDALKANLYAAGANNVAHAFTNICGESLMDRRYS